MSLLQNARPTEKTINNFINYLENYAQINLHFSGEQLVQLHKIVGETSVTVHDALIAYIIVLLNTFYFESDEEHIRHAITIINYPGVYKSITSQDQAVNAILRI